MIAIDDGSFLGGVRPFDGGDDGLFYDSVGRDILQKLLAGDISGFLIGGENVFYYGGPGLRYFRAFEHILFGESYLGYLSLVLLLPFAAYGLFKRFLPGTWAIALAIGFVAIPVGELFGTTFIDYAKWAARGFADPAAYILFIIGLWVLVGARPPAPNEKFRPALFGALLLALGIAMKPIVAPAAAVFLGGAGLATLYFRQWRRLAGMCIGFLPVFSMALHNWIFGHALVLFSANAAHPLVLVMPPSAYAAAFHELITLNFAGGKFLRALSQIPEWLSSGPAESYYIVPLSAAGVVMLVYVVFCGRRFDPWLRLIGAAALAQHAVALFYVGTARYHLLTWFLTMLVVMVFLREIGFDWLAPPLPRSLRAVRSTPLVASGWLPVWRGSRKFRQKKQHEQKSRRHRERSDQLRRPRFLSLSAALLRQVDGLYQCVAGQAGGRHRLYRLRLQQLPPPFSRTAGGGEARRARRRRAADGIPDHLARRSLSSTRPA